MVTGEWAEVCKPPQCLTQIDIYRTSRARNIRRCRAAHNVHKSISVSWLEPQAQTDNVLCTNSNKRRAPLTHHCIHQKKTSKLAPHPTHLHTSASQQVILNNSCSDKNTFQTKEQITNTFSKVKTCEERLSLQSIYILYIYIYIYIYICFLIYIYISKHTFGII